MNKDNDDGAAEYFEVLPSKLVRSTCQGLLVPLTVYLGGQVAPCLGETESAAFACKPVAGHLLHIEESTANASLSSSSAFHISLVMPSSGV